MASFTKSRKNRGTTQPLCLTIDKDAVLNGPTCVIALLKWTGVPSGGNDVAETERGSEKGCPAMRPRRCGAGQFGSGLWQLEFSAYMSCSLLFTVWIIPLI